MLNLYEKVEALLTNDPKMSTSQLVRLYIGRYSQREAWEIDLFMAMLEEAYVPSLIRMASRFRKNIGVRDEVRIALAEEEKRQQSQAKCLEANPPRLVHIDLFA